MAQVIKENLGFDYISATNVGRNFTTAINTIVKTGKPLEVTSRSSVEGILLTKDLFLEMEEKMNRLSAQNDKLFEEIAIQRIKSLAPGDQVVVVTEGSDLMKELDDSKDITKNIFANASDDELFNS